MEISIFCCQIRKFRFWSLKMNTEEKIIWSYLAVWIVVLVIFTILDNLK